VESDDSRTQGRLFDQFQGERPEFLSSILSDETELVDQSVSAAVFEAEF
jgi:hypothetical protein